MILYLKKLLRTTLEKTVKHARDIAENAARAALEQGRSPSKYWRLKKNKDVPS